MRFLDFIERLLLAIAAQVATQLIMHTSTSYHSLFQQSESPAVQAQIMQPEPMPAAFSFSTLTATRLEKTSMCKF